ncbi:sensor histidine kinase [Salinibacterium sp. G-O1]|uniref:sensor histidine kinase n=1 Tax=Salinibacterium sp. G-O1 TaxID=3046208 RepID=UPI0024B8A4A2|nr:sensor histidine kinase [Salinibacterium sp. G-O1]MDJ0335533.1 sensor histidine kinase [Salinibacterium sp. G-O1]
MIATDLHRDTIRDDTMTTPPAPRRASGYGRLWRGLPAEVAYLLIAFPIALTGFVIVITLFSTGIGTLVTFFIGVILIIGALYVARGFGTLDVMFLTWAGRRPISKPEWQDARAASGFFGWLRAVLGNGHYWLYLLHTMIVDFILKVVTWTIMVVWLSLALGGLSNWFWSLFISPDEDWYVSEWLFPDASLDFRATDSLLLFALGLVFAATLPFVSRALISLHWLVARGMLGAWKSDALQRQVVTLEQSRGAAHAAEGHSLRRLERDIHDGPQQRLVRLQMDLAAAQRQLDADPEKSRALIAEAMQQSKDALEELRALSRGIAPPILLDRGLIAALESAADRSTVPTRIVDELPAGTELAQEIERNAYFVVSEALANAAKHSRATAVEVVVSLASGAESQVLLRMTVTDNGVGGAFSIVGHGIAGLQERLRGLGGTLHFSSPAGGPTVITADIPANAGVTPA